jgi:nitrite reductase/ring-hydroxylating ferredoxin subunit
MPEVNLGPASAFADPGRRVVEIDGVGIGVFQLRGQFTAYLNICPHQGGPVCQGKMIAKVDEDIGPDRKSRGMVFSKTQTNIVCPWHGYEFDIATGRHPGNPRVRLRSLPVKVVDGDVVVMVSDRLRDAVLQPAGDSGESRASL